MSSQSFPQEETKKNSSTMNPSVGTASSSLCPSAPAVDDDVVIAAPQETANSSESSSAAVGSAPREPAEIHEDSEQEPQHEENADEDEEESDYEYEDEDEAAYSGFLVSEAHNMMATSASKEDQHPTDNANAGETSGNEKEGSVSVVEEEPAAAAASSTAPGSKWREPSRAAVNMSLRAEKETSGSKRRLAQDLYRIMNQDTQEAGFSLAPQSEDSMDKWTIKLFQFDEDSNLAKDLLVVGINAVELEMSFPDDYPFEPPFVRVVKPRFKRQTGFVMNGALCMELLTKDGWNPINDIESVIVSIRSLLTIGDGRLQAASELSTSSYKARLEAAQKKHSGKQPESKRQKGPEKEDKLSLDVDTKLPPQAAGSYTAAEAKSAYSHLSDYHKKKGWDANGWWAKRS